MVIAGSQGFSGAASLCANGALRVGAGLVYLGVPAGLINVVETKLTEVVKIPLPQTDRVTISRDGVRPILERLSDLSVLIIGPGISTDTETKDFFLELIRKTSLPVVIDADGVNNIGSEPELLKDRKGETVLTPHPGELARLIGILPDKINQNRIEIAREYARRFKVILVIKGAPTVIANPEGEVWVNPTGNSGLGSGGSGDVLTGMIGGLIAQGATPFDSAKAGVYLHGLAADLAVKAEGSEYSLVAGDLLRFIGRAINHILSEDTE
jgi:NAD(P)H-hydrate epimerase